MSDQGSIKRLRMQNPQIDWRAQIEAAISGHAPQYIPAVFRMSRWYKARLHENNMPPETAGKRLEELEAYLGLARSARYAKVYKITFRAPVECVTTRIGDDITVEYRTPRGTLRRVTRFAPDQEAVGIDPYIVEYPIKTWDDYAALAEVYRHMEFVPTYEEYARYDAEIGRAGLPMVILGGKPFHHILQEWTGYQKGFMDLYDRPDVFLETVEAGNAAYRRMWEVVANSPARLLLHGINFDRMMTSPPVFREHFLPYLREFCGEMHAAGKWVACHADGNATGLLELILECGFDVADCFACHPLVPCTVADARRVWGDRLTIWGALPSTLLEPEASIEALESHLESLYREMAPGKRFILGLTDMAMPTTSWKHLLFVRQWLQQRSKYPIH